MFTMCGYDVAVMSPSPDNAGVAFSIMTASFELVRKINASRPRAEVREAYPHAEVYYVNLLAGKPQFIARGGQPAFGKGPFEIILAE